MATLKELKTRIGSVSSSEKITGAMKMISSAKVRKCEYELRKLLPFKNQLKGIMSHLLQAGEEYSSPLTQERELKHYAIAVFGSDDGLCGAYNVNIFKYMLVQIRDMRRKYGETLPITIYPVGKKIYRAVEKYSTLTQGIAVKSVDGVNSKMEGNVVNKFTSILQNGFSKGYYDRVDVVFMQFKSIGKQVASTEMLFPVDGKALSEQNGLSEANNGEEMYIFEPDANSIFNEVLPMFVQSAMQEITIENRASEQAARIMAMQAANDNAKKLQESLQLEYNKLRQQGITTELLDILGGQVDR